jgi:ElaB/YqjD/DUF883 family membrane-anchored ribosome-binding protein
MTTTSTVSDNLRDKSNEAARKAALETSSDIQSDVQALRDEFRRLAERVGNIVADKGNAAWQHARPTVEGVVSDAQEKGRDVVDAVRDVTDNFVEAIDKSIKNRPYTTLALFAAVAFVLGATRRR